MTDQPPISFGDVHVAFKTGAVLTASDDRLTGYLRVLCSTEIQSNANQLLAANRCFSINTILMQRFLDRANKATTRLTWVVIVLAGLSVVAMGVQILLAWP